MNDYLIFDHGNNLRELFKAPSALSALTTYVNNNPVCFIGVTDVNGKLGVQDFAACVVTLYHGGALGLMAKKVFA